LMGECLTYDECTQHNWNCASSDDCTDPSLPNCVNCVCVDDPPSGDCADMETECMLWSENMFGPYVPGCCVEGKCVHPQECGYGACCSCGLCGELNSIIPDDHYGKCDHDPNSGPLLSDWTTKEMCLDPRGIFPWTMANGERFLNQGAGRRGGSWKDEDADYGNVNGDGRNCRDSRTPGIKTCYTCGSEWECPQSPCDYDLDCYCNEDNATCGCICTLGDKLVHCSNQEVGVCENVPGDCALCGGSVPCPWGQCPDVPCNAASAKESLVTQYEHPSCSFRYDIVAAAVAWVADINDEQEKFKFWPGPDYSAQDIIDMFNEGSGIFGADGEREICISTDWEGCKWIREYAEFVDSDSVRWSPYRSCVEFTTPINFPTNWEDDAPIGGSAFWEDWPWSSWDGWDIITDINASSRHFRDFPTNLIDREGNVTKSNKQPFRASFMRHGACCLGDNCINNVPEEMCNDAIVWKGSGTFIPEPFVCDGTCDCAWNPNNCEVCLSTGQGWGTPGCGCPHSGGCQTVPGIGEDDCCRTNMGCVYLDRNVDVLPPCGEIPPGLTAGACCVWYGTEPECIDSPDITLCQQYAESLSPDAHYKFHWDGSSCKDLNGACNNYVGACCTLDVLDTGASGGGGYCSTKTYNECWNLQQNEFAGYKGRCGTSYWHGPDTCCDLPTKVSEGFGGMWGLCYDRDTDSFYDVPDGMASVSCPGTCGCVPPQGGNPLSTCSAHANCTFDTHPENCTEGLDDSCFCCCSIDVTVENDDNWTAEMCNCVEIIPDDPEDIVIVPGECAPTRPQTCEHFDVDSVLWQEGFTCTGGCGNPAGSPMGVPVGSNLNIHFNNSSSLLSSVHNVRLPNGQCVWMSCDKECPYPDCVDE
jgi:hypothetical protein